MTRLLGDEATLDGEPENRSNYILLELITIEARCLGHILLLIACLGRDFVESVRADYFELVFNVCTQ